MTTVTAAQVKELRQLTGAGLSDCKRALVDNDGDLAEAQSWLRARGSVLAERKADRDTSEGSITVAVDGKVGVLVEVLAETDFVASNDVFQTFAGKVAQAALQAGAQVDDLSQLETPEGPVEQLREQAIAQTGENIKLGRSARIEATGELAHYVHHDGKIGVLVDCEGVDAATGRQLGMHVASMRPTVLDRDSFDPEELERQRAALAEAVRESGKPAEVQAKMIEGKLNKLLGEKVFLMQEYAWDDSVTVGKFLERNGGRVNGFRLLHLGG